MSTQLQRNIELFMSKSTKPGFVNFDTDFQEIYWGSSLSSGSENVFSVAHNFAHQIPLESASTIEQNRKLLGLH